MSIVPVDSPKPLPNILAITAECRRRRALGESIVDLSLGEPDFDTPPHICEAAMLAIEEGGTRYTPPAGLPQLRQMVVRSLGSEGLRFARRDRRDLVRAPGAAARRRRSDPPRAVLSAVPRADRAQRRQDRDRRDQRGR